MKSQISFSGTWVSLDDASSVEIAIRKAKGGFAVTVTDAYDGEIAAVSEIEYRPSESLLLFATYWASTGRFTRYRMALCGPGRLQITYTHTDSEIMIRKR